MCGSAVRVGVQGLWCTGGRSAEHVPQHQWGLELGLVLRPLHVPNQLGLGGYTTREHREHTKGTPQGGTGREHSNGER